MLLTLAIAVGLAAGDDVQPLITQLQAKDTKDKLAAIAKLSDLGPKAQAAVVPLVEALRVPNEDVRLNASLALGKIGKAAVVELIEASGHADADVRFYALWSLGWIGPDAQPATNRAVAALTDASDNVRRKAAWTLGRIGATPAQVIPGLVKLLGDKNADVQRTAAEALSKLGPTALPPLVQAARQQDVQASRIVALWALGNMKSEAKDAIDEIKTLLSDPNPEVRFSTATILGRIGKDSIPVLVEALGHADLKVSGEAVKALAVIGAPAVPQLVDALGHKTVEVRRAAANALGPLRIGDKMVVVGLGHSLKDEDQQVKLNCLRALQMLGVQAKFAGPQVLAALEDSALTVRQQALYTLRSLGPDPEGLLPPLARLFKTGDANLRSSIIGMLSPYGQAAVPLLLEAVQVDDASVRSAAVRTLAFMPVDLKDHHALFSKLTKDADPTVRNMAYQALGKVGPAALKELRDGLRDGNAITRGACITGLRNLGPAAKEALPDLAQIALKEVNLPQQRGILSAMVSLGPDSVPHLAELWKKNVVKNYNRTLLVQSLGNFGAAGKDGVPTLIDALQDKMPQVRWQAAVSLGNIGPAAQAAIPALKALSSDPEMLVRTNAVSALTKIQGEK